MSKGKRNDRENMLMQLGDYCTTHLCKNCPFKKLAEEHHHGCPEFLRIPEMAHFVSEILKHRRTNKEKWGEATDV
jgi:hypothetical protein